MTGNATEILLVEDDQHLYVRLQLLLLDMGYSSHSIHWAASVKDALQLIQQHTFALALIDLVLPDGEGQTIIRSLRALDAQAAILVISAWSSEDQIMGALRAGATGYLLKERDNLELRLGIRSAMRGGAPIDPFIAKSIIRDLVTVAPAPAITPTDFALSKRELQILLLVADGMTNREIAENVFLSRHTVECHVKRIYQKMSVNSRTKAVNVGRTHGLIS